MDRLYAEKKYEKGVKKGVKLALKKEWNRWYRGILGCRSQNALLERDISAVSPPWSNIFIA